MTLDHISPNIGCFGCEACFTACPFGAIQMREDGEGFLYPEVRAEACTGCGRCQSVCPATHTDRWSVTQTYAVRARDMGLLEKSTSGGAFTLIASRILAMGGLVVGAAFDENMEVSHVIGTDLSPMRKSKYVQSTTHNALGALLSEIEKGRPVLFSGTPCQADGVRRLVSEVLGNQICEKYLYTLSLICHGVLSPGLWRDYVHYLKGKGHLEHYDFRDKSQNNEGHTVCCQLSGTKHLTPMVRDPFSRIYLTNLALRPSCHQCPYTRSDTPSDLTIGDLFAPHRFFEDWNDGRGASTLLVRSLKGMSLIQDLERDAEIRILPPEGLSVPSLTVPVKVPMMRRFLMGDYRRKDASGHCDMELILKKYGGAQMSASKTVPTQGH